MARAIASGVISWKTIRLVGTLGLSSWSRCPAMVWDLDGDSTMTSLVPWPSPAAALALLAPALAVPAWPLPVRPALAGALAALAVAAAFVFVVSVLAGTLFPSSHPRRDRLRYPWSRAALQLQPSARFGVFPYI